jgi:glycosyltransferase involved in cell wall biosynthesis
MSGRARLSSDPFPRCREAHSTDEIRVLHVISGLFYGGGHGSTIELVAALRAVAGIKASICALGRPVSPLDRTVVSWVPYDGRYSRPDVACLTAAALRRFIEGTGVNIVHTHGWDADLVSALALGSRDDCQHVVHLRTSRRYWGATGMRPRLARAAYKMALARSRPLMIAVSRSVRSYHCEHLGWDPSRISVVLNGIEIDRFPYSERAQTAGRSVVVGTAARLVPDKGIADLLQACAEMRRRGTDLVLRLAGDGSYRQELTQCAHALGLGAAVQFLGSVSEMEAFYRTLDVFVLPSHSEGLPRVVLEAMASGCCVVATRVGGVPEAVRDGVDGLLVPHSDPRALAGALERVVEDSGLRQALAASARRRVEQEFTLDRVAAEVASVYERSLARRDLPAASSAVP